MKEIQLVTKGFTALVDDEDYERAAKHHWRLQRNGRNLYVNARINRKTITLHRFLLSTSSAHIDHRNGNGLDCRKENLRPATVAQNLANSRKKLSPTTSKYKGVSWDKQYQKWRAVIDPGSKTKYLGRFTDEVDAALAYDAAARLHFGEFALCNFPEKKPCVGTPHASTITTAGIAA
jgi:hypothetical protein